MAETRDVMVLEETLDPASLECAMNHARASEPDMVPYLRVLQKRCKKRCSYKVVYSRKVYGRRMYGRMYARGEDNVSLQRLSRNVRSFLCRGRYTDVDMVNSNYVLLENLAKSLNCKMDALAELNLNRESVMKDMCADSAKTREEVKKWVTQIPNSVDVTMSANLQRHAGHHTELFKAVCGELREIRRVILEQPGNLVFTEIAKTRNPDNVKGSALTFVLQDIENDILERLVESFRDRGYVPRVLMFDGLLIDGVHENLPLACVQECHPSYAIRLVTKLMHTTIDDNLAEPLRDVRTFHKLGQLVDKYMEFVEVERVFRWQSKGNGIYDEFYVADKERDWSYEKVDSALCLVQRFQRHSKSDSVADKLLMSSNWLVCFTEKQFDSRFPERTPNPNHFGYSDGVFDAYNNRFMRNGLDHFACRTWKEHAFPGWDTEVPKWTALLSHQLPDSGERREFEALLGRLFFPVGELDTWQVILGVQGQSGTGKSTVLSIVHDMFPPGSVTTICDSSSGDFILENKDTKRCIMIPDASENLHHKLPIGLIKTMACGEIVSVNAKGKAETVAPWSTPVVIAFNRNLGYQNDGGAWVRRFACVPWTRAVVDKDTTLMREILKDTYRIFPALVRAYHEMRARVGSECFWKHASETLLIKQESTKVDSDVLLAFLKSENVVCEVDAVCSMADFRLRFRQYVQTTSGHSARYRWTKECDYPTMTGMGVEVLDNANVCRSCGGLGKTCCEMSDRNNRTRRTVLKNLRLI